MLSPRNIPAGIGLLATIPLMLLRIFLRPFTHDKLSLAMRSQDLILPHDSRQPFVGVRYGTDVLARG